MRLPENPREVFRLTKLENLLFSSVIYLAKIGGFWRYPAKYSGDLETMGFWDKAYWLYKAENPVEKPIKGSNLEHIFKKESYKISNGVFKEIAHEVSISAVGDLINHPFLENSKSVLYKDVEKVIFDNDISMANLECCIWTEGEVEFEFSSSKGPSLYYTDSEFDVIKGVNGNHYSFMATACNHSLDFGVAGVESTIQALETRGISYNGLNLEKKKGPKVTFIDKNNIKIGVIAYTFGLNAYKPPTDHKNIVNHLNLNDSPELVDTSKIERQIQQCKNERADFIIAQLHWGMEHEFYPRPEQVDLAHKLADLGVDAIIGHHPHVVQPIEFYKPKRDPLRVVPIYYSLGNLINTFTADYLTLSYVAKLELTKGENINGECRTYVSSACVSKIRQIIDEMDNTIQLIEI